MSVENSAQQIGMHERFSQLSLPFKVALGAVVVAAAIGSTKGYDTLHDHIHPELHVGTTDDDVSEAARLLEGSRYSAYETETLPTTATEDLMAAIITFQVDRDIDSEHVGSLQKGDETWDALKDSQHEDTTEGLPTDCYEAEDVICVVQDRSDHSANLYVLHNGDEKMVIEGTGVGRPSDVSDNGEFTIDPARMYQTYFSQAYNHTPMPFAMFYNGGEAIHFSQLKAQKGDDYPGSGGCVTIGDIKQAEDLFEYTRQVVNDGRDMQVMVSES